MKNKKEITHKFLVDIGQPNSTMDCDDKRYKKMREYEQEHGVFPPNCWDLDWTMLRLLYEHVRQYRIDAIEVVDLTFHTFEFNGKTYNQLQLIDHILELCEYLLTDLEELDKDSPHYNAFMSNKYYIEYGEHDPNEHRELVREVWEAWTVIYPSMWW